MPTELYARYFKDKDFLLSFFGALIFFAASLIINFYAGIYATESASNAVTDIVLSNTRVFDVDGLFVYGTIFFWVFVLVLGFLRPQRLPFILKSIALFVLVRSVFISMTHIGPYPSHLIVDSNIMNWFAFAGDLFFSGHTGLPFLMALAFWEDRLLRSFFIAMAVIFGIIVLVAHLHYTIDVLAAFFITYTIYHIAETLFKKDKELFSS